MKVRPYLVGGSAIAFLLGSLVSFYPVEVLAARVCTIMTGEGTGLNLRKTPGGEISEIVPNGTEVTIMGRETRGWLQIKSDQGTGYVWKQYLKNCRNS